MPEDGGVPESIDFKRVGEIAARDILGVTYGRGVESLQIAEAALAAILSELLEEAYRQLVAAGVTDPLYSLLGVRTTEDRAGNSESAGLAIVAAVFGHLEPRARSDVSRDALDKTTSPTANREMAERLNDAGWRDGAHLAAISGASLRKAIELLGRCAPSEEEIVATTLRLAYAEVVTAAVRFLEVGSKSVRSSNRDYGMIVGKELAKRFVEYYHDKLGHPVLAESTVTYQGERFALSEARRRVPVPYSSRFERLRTALSNPNAKRLDGNDYRVDIFDCERLELWEVKPALSADRGIGQLFFISAAYNCLLPGRAAQDGLGDSEQIKLGKSIPPTMLRPIPVEVLPTGRSVYALPFVLPALPGLLLYVIVVGPSLAELEALAFGDLVRRMVEAIRRLPRRSSGEVNPVVVVAGVAAVCLVLTVAVLVAAPAVLTVLKVAAVSAVGGTILMPSLAAANPGSRQPETETRASDVAQRLNAPAVGGQQDEVEILTGYGLFRTASLSELLSDLSMAPYGLARSVGKRVDGR